MTNSPVNFCFPHAILGKIKGRENHPMALTRRNRKRLYSFALIVFLVVAFTFANFLHSPPSGTTITTTTRTGTQTITVNTNKVKVSVRPNATSTITRSTNPVPSPR